MPAVSRIEAPKFAQISPVTIATLTVTEVSAPKMPAIAIASAEVTSYGASILDSSCQDFAQELPFQKDF